MGINLKAAINLVYQVQLALINLLRMNTVQMKLLDNTKKVVVSK